MQFYDVIQKRTSIKQFKNTPVDKSKLTKIIEAAMMSPSWKNKICYRFILVDDERKKQLISEAVLNDSQDAAQAIRQAPFAVVIVADPSKSGVVQGREYYLVDSAIAMEHFILAATNEGYGTCWIGALDENKVREALSIPDMYRVVGMTPVGETNENIVHYPKKDFSQYIFNNTWENSYNGNNQFLQ